MQLLPQRDVGVYDSGSTVTFLVIYRSMRAALAPSGEYPPLALKAVEEKVGSYFWKDTGRTTCQQVGWSAVGLGGFLFMLVMGVWVVPSRRHIWELPGNYRDFIVVMVFYLFCWRTKRILVTAITDFKIYILIQSSMLFI